MAESMGNISFHNYFAVKEYPSDSKTVETIAEKFGTIKKTEYEELRLFPFDMALLNVSEDDMRKCGVGY